MNSERIMREWFGAVRAAADKAAEFTDSAALSELSRRKVSMLLRQYLFDGLDARIIEAEGLPAAEAEKICKDIYTDLMEDIIAGVWSPEETMETAMFLRECTNGVTDENIFRTLMEKALGTAADPDTAEKLREEAGRKLNKFFEYRKKENQPEPPRQRRDDEPPPWLDEFEYIDWVITH